jgi:exodeoxyribonuclease V alpha subunit
MEWVGIFKNPRFQDGFFQSDFYTKDGQKLIARTKHFPFLHVNTKITGDMKNNAFIEVINVQPLLPFSTLAKPFLKSIPTGVWDRIEKNWGDEAISIITEHPERLNEVSENPEHQRLLRNFVKYKLELPNLKNFLSSYGVNLNNIQKIIELLGPISVERIIRNPYLLGETGMVSPKIMDAMAKVVGISPNDPKRLHGVTAYLTTLEMNNGHTFLIRDAFVRKMQSYLKKDFSRYEIEQIALEYWEQKDWKIYEQRVYSEERYWAEYHLAERMPALVRAYPGKTPNTEQIDAFLDHLIKEKIIPNLSTEQREAVHTFWRNQFSLLCGGPGTGKSSVVKAITLTIDHFKPHIKYALAGPTGLSAQRLGPNARTLHHLLGKYGDGRPLYRFDKNPLPYEAYIIDENGMIDVYLMKDFIRAVPNESKILLIGDPNQLPPVGPGEPFTSFLEFQIPVTYLTTNFRSGNGSIIDQMLHAILEKDEEKVLTLLENQEVFIFHEGDSVEDVQKIIGDLREKLTDAPILTPYRETYQLGSIRLNEYLQSRLNPSEKRLEGFRIGDPVIQYRTNKTRGIYNGNKGFITDINQDEFSLKVYFHMIGEEKYYLDEAIQEIELAYAMTVHKVQGQEFDVVILPFLNEEGQGKRSWNLPLLYTAISRAKQQVHLVGRKEVFVKSLMYERKKRRNDLLFKMKRAFEAHLVTT